MRPGAVQHGAALALALLAAQVGAAPAGAAPPPLTAGLAERLAGLALSCIDREFPNKPENVMESREDVRPPRMDHPVFFGCFDWHSAVHGHYMLMRLMRAFPGHPLARKIERILDERLTPERVEGEVQYMMRPSRRAFERPYGWAWLLRLVLEARASGRARWVERLRPLEGAVVQKMRDYLPKLSHPSRAGTHANTAFALGQALDYARAAGDQALLGLLEERSRTYFGEDRDASVAYEPSGEDFFSPILAEADLMRRVMGRAEFAAWLSRLLPDLSGPACARWLTPVRVTDVTDGKLVHLLGLNLSRAWMLRGISSALPVEDGRRALLERAADAHAGAGLAGVFSGHYEGEHWLASFAVYERTEREGRQDSAPKRE